MESASSAARDSGQQQVQEPAPDVEGEPPTGVSMEIDDGKRGALPSVMGTNTRRRLAEITSPAETQPRSSAVAPLKEELSWTARKQ